ncbi:hypothetical protein CALCODRAFT_485335 [Calocera cornea HHB12733]|uniref:DRBM domain-containing protein n=1 Tax=Calocera cornea HHB12733 TaxID=1353952 RepID=A0A165EED6_9BASI|nr:hypothetical protein CALCODRAFT_485335 [Calocera cornea HHB12733]
MINQTDIQRGRLISWKYDQTGPLNAPTHEAIPIVDGIEYAICAGFGPKRADAKEEAAKKLEAELKKLAWFVAGMMSV